MMKDDTGLQTLLDPIRARGAVLFGTGFVAEMFYKALSERKLGGCVRGFVVSGAGGGTFHGRPVYSLAGYAKDHTDAATAPLMCIAVHERVRTEIERSLDAVGITEHVWIYPQCLKLIWGPAVQDAVWIPLRDILKAQDEDQDWITVRYAAMRFLVDTAEGETAAAVYRKAMGLFCSKETADKRLAAARALAGSMGREGFDPRHPVWIDARYRVIDGLHRLAAAALNGIEMIPCHVVAATERFNDYLTDDNRFAAAARARAGITASEERLLQSARTELTGGQPPTRRPEISVILPVYNVEDYMDQCLESVVAQTMGDIEILLINDGSTDGSLAKCLEWERRDPRVTVFDRANDGVASARNLGIDMARGEYLAFVDPDDWLDETYLEKLWRAARDADADYAECDLWRYDNRSGKKIYRACYGRMGQNYTLQEHMKYGPTATYKAISRRSLWVGNGVRMPSCSFESPAVYSLLLGLSRRVVNVREALYYYRRFRENSLIENGYAHSDGTPDSALGVEAMDFLIREFRRTGLFDRYADTLEGIVKYRLSDILAMQFHRRSPEDFGKLTERYRAFLASAFPTGHNEPYITWGGYNLNRILAHMDWLHDPFCRFNFSSLIALDRAPADRYSPVHKNRYRQMMLERELKQRFWGVLRDARPAYMFIDLLEERFDTLCLGDCRVTMSDAFEGGCFDDVTTGERGISARELSARGRRIPFDSRERADLWQESCRRVFERVMAIRPALQFVIVENYLSESFGDLAYRETFAELESIRQTNKVLRGYYQFLKELLPGAKVILPEGDPLYFTDAKYEYGAIPPHLNEIENQKIAERIREML